MRGGKLVLFLVGADLKVGPAAQGAGLKTGLYVERKTSRLDRVIRSVAVLGAGVMGAQIAAHFANAGVPALLLDLTHDAAAQGLQRARALKPDPFFTPETWKLVTTAGFEDGLPRLAAADWIIEAVVERLDV